MWYSPFPDHYRIERRVNLKKYCLLIGNTRWHWAIQEKDKWKYLHTAPNEIQLTKDRYELICWAAVGAIPKEIHLDPKKCIQIKDIPLSKLPNWIGIDRALTGWAALEQAKANDLHSKGIIVADAGTVLSITRITANGEFAGGQLIAGLQLQLNAMAKGTKNLRKIQKRHIPRQDFPLYTEDAMLKGTFDTLLGSLLNIQKKTNMPLWLCGGDSEILYEHLKKFILDLHHVPVLGLEGMTKIKL